jgi:hypothetical protein
VRDELTELDATEESLPDDTPAARGEVLAGLAIENKTVAQVLPQVEARGVKVDYLTGDGPNFESRGSVPGNWYVRGAITYRPGQVSLHAGPSPQK